MSMGLAFWIIFLIWVVFWPGWGWANGPYLTYGHNLVLLILLLLLGWKTFGAPLHG